MRKDDYLDDTEYDSPTTWRRMRGESDEDFSERIQDQEDLIDYYND